MEILDFAFDTIVDYFKCEIIWELNPPVWKSWQNSKSPVNCKSFGCQMLNLYIYINLSCIFQLACLVPNKQCRGFEYMTTNQQVSKRSSEDHSTKTYANYFFASCSVYHLSVLYCTYCTHTLPQTLVYIQPWPLSQMNWPIMRSRQAVPVEADSYHCR